MSIRKLNSLPYGNCYVKDYGNVIVLVSYSTPVIIVEDSWLHINGLYSATTRKHIGKFMREMGYGDYQLAKKLFTMKVDYNVETGEIVDW